MLIHGEISSLVDIYAELRFLLAIILGWSKKTLRLWYERWKWRWRSQKDQYDGLFRNGPLPIFQEFEYDPLTQDTRNQRSKENKQEDNM